ncbi:MAG TPA: hypothetical protein VFG69_02055, partial [Nannocystaceae bacterium]|nr:hypothetical protein [Nannocystaceae bacterium]
LARIVRDEALDDPDETWMLAHAIEAFGADVALDRDGGPALAAILGRATLVDGQLRFAGASASGTLRDPHPNHTLATLLAAGVPGTQAFVVGDATVTLADLHAHAVAAFERPSGTAWGEQAWTLRAMAEAVEVDVARVEITNARGERFDGLELARAAADEILAEMRFLGDARREGKAVRKRGQGIWAQPCGGLHSIEAVAVWLRVRDDAELRASVERIGDVLAYRVGVEADLYAWMRGQAPPDIATKLDAQELKFFGHVLDTADELARAGVPLDDVAIAEAKARVVAAVRRLEDSGALARIGALQLEDPQLYRDLVGDAAHAVAGLSAR